MPYDLFPTPTRRSIMPSRRQYGGRFVAAARPGAGAAPARPGAGVAPVRPGVAAAEGVPGTIHSVFVISSVETPGTCSFVNALHCAVVVWAAVLPAKQRRASSASEEVFVMITT